MPNRPDIKDLGELLEALRTRDTLVYYVGLVLSAIGMLGIVCLLNAIFPVSLPWRPVMSKSNKNAFPGVKRKTRQVREYRRRGRFPLHPRPIHGQH